MIDTKRGRERFGKGMKKEYRCTLRTKKMIRAAFVELLGEKKNMETITVGELAERADIAKKIFEYSAVLPFSKNKAEKYAQIRFLTNACVDTMVDYFKGNIALSLEEVGEVIIDFLNKMKK